jgi:hypothetical protein
MRSFVLVAFVFGCARAAPPAEVAPAPAAAPEVAATEIEPSVPAELSSWAWSSISVASGKVAEVRQVPSAKGVCKVSAAVGSETVWSIDACLATSDDLRYVSPDALALVVLKPLPSTDEVTLGAVYRKGQRVLALTPTSLHLAANTTRMEANRFLWLGTREQREVAEGVDVQLLDGSSLVIRFDGQAPAARATRPGSVAQQACSPCSYTDAEGVYHLVDSAEEIPAQYRPQAGRILGSVQRAVATPITPSPPAAPEPAPRRRRHRSDPAPAESEQPDVPRNELGEDFIQYNTRLMEQALHPTTDFDAKCIDNSGASVPCSEIGMQSY